MKINMVPIGEIKPYEKNPRRIPPAAVEVVRRSLEKFGWQQPLVVSKSMVLIVGHIRFLAAQELGHEEVPVKVADELTADELREYRLVDNRSVGVHRLGSGTCWPKRLPHSKSSLSDGTKKTWRCWRLLAEGKEDQQGWEADNSHKKHEGTKPGTGGYSKPKEEEVSEGCVMLHLIVPKDLEAEVQEAVRELIAEHEEE